MEYWRFNKKELKFIAILMVKRLLSLPDNSELSVADLLEQTLQAFHVEGTDKDGYPIHGYKVCDIELGDGSHLHDHVKWDFENGVWNPYFEQGLELEELFYAKAKREGYVIDGSRHAGCKVGHPFCIERVFRNKKNLIRSFMSIEKTMPVPNEEFAYTILARHETRQNQYREHPSGTIVKFAERRTLQLMILPVGCNTGKTFHKWGNICLYVLKGKCRYCDSYWDYSTIYPKRNARWNETKNRCELKCNESVCSRKNRNAGDVEAPSDAWYQLTNIGKSDLLVFIADQSLIKRIEYEPYKD